MGEHFVRVCGLLFPRGFSPEAITSAINYKPKPGEIFVASYPKCGTTWLQKIVLLILRKGKQATVTQDIFFDCPYIDMSGTEDLDTESKPLALKTHLPYHLTPLSKDAKYIYICRHPMDCMVSFYHHLTNLEEMTFDEYMDLYFMGNLVYGDYLDHLVGWYKHKDDPNVHFLTYESLKKDTRGEILKIAKFIGEEYWKLLMEDPNMLDDIIRYSSFDYMKQEVNEVLEKFWKGEIDTTGRKLSAGLKSRLDYNKEKAKVGKPSKGSSKFLRKGVVGDGKNYFTPEHKRQFEDRINEKTTECGVMALWEC